MTQNGKHFLLL